MKLSSPVAILIGSVIIALSILIANGVIPVKTSKTTQNENNLFPTVNPTIQPSLVEVKMDPMSDSDHIRGGKDARIILVEYSDLECPYCKQFHNTAQKALEAYPGQLAWVYRHFPLDTLHSKARKEAEATECANELGGSDMFWKMADKIYQVTPSNNGLDLLDLPLLAKEIGLDQAKFTSCLDSGKYKDTVEKQYQSGVKAGVRGTPGNFLMDTKSGKTISLPGAVPLESLKQSIDSLLQS